MNPYSSTGARLALCLLVLGTQPVHAAPALPTEAFARLPEVSQLQLSPDGKQLAMMVNKDANTAIVVQDLDHPERAPVPLLNTTNQDYHYRWLHWAGNTHVVVSMGFPAKRNYPRFLSWTGSSVHFSGFPARRDDDATSTLPGGATQPGSRKSVQSSL